MTAGRALLPAPARSSLLNEPEEPGNPCENGTPRSSRGQPRLSSLPFFIWPDIFWQTSSLWQGIREMKLKGESEHGQGAPEGR